MNDFFMLGISAGVPTLVCFATYLGLSFRRKSPPLNFNFPFSAYTVCRAGYVVLLVGFWLDGGLFKLSIAPIFWMLIELSKIESSVPLSVLPAQEKPINCPKKEIWLWRLAWVLAALAFLQQQPIWRCLLFR
jgi:hypothetical protein